MSSRRTVLQAAGLVITGAVAGGVLATTIGASAGTPSATGPGGNGGYGGPPASYAAGPDGDHHRGPRAPMTAGTVTAVGAKSVTIKTTAGTKTYAVDADSDIDKNGEATVSDLAAGDAVHFAVRPGTSTIAVLHAGDEAKNRPAFGGHHGPCPGGPGMPGGPQAPDGSPQPHATTSSNA